MKKHIIYTIGHSTRSLAEFLEILRNFGINQLIDVRTIPRSRHNPQFNRETLSVFLRNRHIGYAHMKHLGGLRHARKDSINTAWENASFRGYADYMQTEEFHEALKKLIQKSKDKTVAIMCAEAVPWRCHRSLIADALYAYHIPVVEIMSKTSAHEHKLTAWARIKGHQVWYPK